MTLTLRTGRGLLKYERHHLVYVADVTYVDGVRPVSVIAGELWLSSIAVLMTSDNFKVRRTEHEAFKFGTASSTLVPHSATCRQPEPNQITTGILLYII